MKAYLDRKKGGKNTDWNIITEAVWNQNKRKPTFKEELLNEKKKTGDLFLKIT